MKPKHIKDIRRKEVRQIWKRQREIWIEKRSLGYKKLKKPIRHGWFKEFIITHKVNRYKNNEAILEVYQKVEKLFWGRTKEEAERLWYYQTSKYMIYKGLPTLSRKQFNKLSDKAQRLCTPYQYKNEQKKMKYRYYIRIPKGSYRIKYSRAYVTHSRRIDPLLESESALLDQHFLKPGYYEVNKSFYNWKDHWMIDERKKQKLKTIRALKKLKYLEIEDIVNDNISWDIN